MGHVLRAGDGVSAPASVVLKWPLRIDDSEQKIGSGVVVLTEVQGSTLCVWTREYEGDDNKRTVRVVSTGHLLTGLGAHVGSVLDPPFVWHIFEVTA